VIPDPLTLSSDDRRAKVATYRDIVRHYRQLSSREGRRMTWLERATVRDLLDDIAALEAAEEASP
jgi:hypothetical protein